MSYTKRYCEHCHQPEELDEGVWICRNGRCPESPDFNPRDDEEREQLEGSAPTPPAASEGELGYWRRQDGGGISQWKHDGENELMVDIEVIVRLEGEITRLRAVEAAMTKCSECGRGYVAGDGCLWCTKSELLDAINMTDEWLEDQGYSKYDRKTGLDALAKHAPPPAAKGGE